MGKNQKKQPKVEASTTIKKIFEKKGKTAKGSPKKPSPEVNEPTRSQRSVFLTYVKAALKGKCEETVGQAELVHNHYGSLDGESKKALIMEFFRNGGRKTGLHSVFKQSLEVQQRHHSGSWAGLCTFGKLLSLHDVSWGIKPKQ